MGINLDRPILRFLERNGALLALALACPVIVMARHASPLFAILLAYLLSAQLYWSMARRGGYLARVRSFAVSPLTLATAAFAVVALVSALFSPAPGAFETALQMTGVIVVALAIAASRAELAEWRPGGALLVGGLLGSALLLGDLLSNQFVRMALIPGARITDSNRAAVFIALCMPIFLALARHRGGALPILALSAGLATSASSYSGSAALAAAAGLGAYLAAEIAGRRGVLAMGAAVAAMIVAAPLIAMAFHDAAPAQLFGWTQFQTVEVRALIWRDFATLVPARPILGFGFDASSVAYLLPEAQALPEDARQRLRFGHPHNAPLQIWFDLGAIGALAATAAVVAAFRQIAAMHGPARSAAAGVALAVTAVTFVSHGAWQVWWPLMIAIVAVGFPRFDPPPVKPS